MSEEIGAPAEPRRFRTRSLIVIGLVVLLVAAAVSCAFLGREALRSAAREEGRGAAISAARQFVTNFTTIDYRTFERDIGRVRAMSAGQFGDQYAKATDRLRKLVTASETVSKGKVLEAGIVSFDPDDARVLVVADSDVENAQTKKTEQRFYRMQLDLVRTPDGWRVVDVKFVGG